MITAKHNMIFGQFLPNQLTCENVKNAFLAVDRERLLPDYLKNISYSDCLIKLEHDSYIRYELSALGMMYLLQYAKIKHHERILIMGDPTGYLTLLTSYIAQQVTTLEQNPLWYTKMSEKVYELSLHNVTLFNGPYNVGVPSQAPFDCILIAGCIDSDLSKVSSQLKPRGRMLGFEPITKSHYHQLSRLFLLEKIERTRTKTCLHELVAPNVGVFSSKIPVEQGFLL